MMNLYSVQIVNHTYYLEKQASLNKQIVEGDSAPRGRIYDRNNRLIVDNIPIKTITYKKVSGVSIEEEIDLAYNLAEILEMDISKLKEKDLKKFWIINNSEKANKKISDSEWSSLKAREITSDDIIELKLERITEEDLSKLNDLDKVYPSM